ncbi:MAG: metal-dependent amidase/aminoacylase/carboxypeptidase family protein [Candidatus Azotimanducaceae bacterium]
MTYNDSALTAQMAPVPRRSAKAGNAVVVKPTMGAEDFSCFANTMPGLLVGLGVSKEGAEPGERASNHSPCFCVNDDALPYGVKVLSNLSMT